MNDQKELSVKEFFSYLGPFIIFLGITRQLFYYWSFGITIKSFLEFSEIITSFLDIIVIVFLLFAYSIIQAFLMKSEVEDRKGRVIFKRIVGERNSWKRLEFNIYYHKDSFLSAFFTFFFYFIWTLLDKSIKINTFIFPIVFSLLFFGISLIAVEIEAKHKRLDSTHSHKLLYRLLFKAIIFFSITLGFTYSQVESVKKSKSTFGTIIIFDDNNKLVSDSLNYFIGKTQNYIFFYEESQKSTKVYPVSLVKEITFNQIKSSH